MNESELPGDAVPEESMSAESPQDEMPSVVVPDRADAPVSEITERFFKAIVAKVPIERIEELHLFSPLRSGGVETGIAVVAARVPAPVVVEEPAAPDTPEHQLEAELEDEHSHAMIDGEEVVEVVEFEEPSDDVLIEQEIESATESATDDIAANDGATDEPVADVIELAADDDSPYATEVLHEIVEDAIEESIEYVAEETPAVAVERHTVYTARYRLVQKGPDRGKWEADVVDEADAPLITVEMVVRGVQRRAGEASETTRYTGSQIARALRLG